MFDYTNCSVEHLMKLNWGAKRKKINFLFLFLNVIKVCYILFLLDYHAAAGGKAGAPAKKGGKKEEKKVEVAPAGHELSI